MWKYKINMRYPKYILHRYYAKEVRFGPDVKSLMLQGVDILANAVAVTMGPKGRNVILEQPFGPPQITKDGVTIAKGIVLSDKIQNIGAKLVQNVANKTNEEAGDGTTTATILARAIAKEGFENISKGANPIEIRKGIILAVQKVKDQLKVMSKPINSETEIEQVATLSANGDTTIGKNIAQALKKVGKDDAITVKDGKTMLDELEILEGMKFGQGFISPYFINSIKGPRVEYENVLILLCQRKIFSIQELIPALEICSAKKSPLLIIAEDLDSDVLSLLILNKLKIGLPVVAVKAPGFGENRIETLFDMAVATGGVLFEDNTNLIRLEDCREESLGKAGEVIITKDSTLIIKGRGQPETIEQRVAQIKEDLKKCMSDREKLKLIERLRRIKGRVAILHIGGCNEIEVKERKDRVIDALNATQAAIEEGVIAGGGSALISCIPSLSTIIPENNDQQIGIKIVMNALKIPCATIATNAGVDGSVVASKVEELGNGFGYDVNSNMFVNMLDKGIIDPTKVLRRALTDASGIASLLTTAEAVICEFNDNKQTKISTEPDLTGYNEYV